MNGAEFPGATNLDWNEHHAVKAIEGAFRHQRKNCQISSNFPHKVTIETTPDVTLDIFTQIVYTYKECTEYDNWQKYPVIKQEKSGEFSITFSATIPAGIYCHGHRPVDVGNPKNYIFVVDQYV